MTKTLLVIQHSTWAGPGRHLRRAARELGVRLEIVKAWKEPLPSPASHHGLIVLGGKPNAAQTGRYPFLAGVKATVAEALRRDIPYLGISLGLHLLAEAVGARIEDNYCASIGFTDGFLTHRGREHPFFRDMPPRFPLFEWHIQALREPLPAPIEILATSAECQVEAIGLKGRPHIIGVQFDNNAAAVDNVGRFVAHEEKWLASVTGKPINPAAIIDEARRLERTTARQFKRLFANFVRLTQPRNP